MDADGLPLVGPGINLTEVDPISPKRMLAFLNHFIVHTASFLNRFSVICDEKLEDLTVRLQRLETTVCLLETKLSSIAGLDEISTARTAVSVPDTAAVVTATTTSTDNEVVDNAPTPETNDETAPAADATATNTAANDPRYAKYFRLLQMQVQKEALQQRMLIEGLDPSVLDNPNAPVKPVAETPSGGEKLQQQNSDSEVEFSDDDNQSSSSHSSDFS